MHWILYSSRLSAHPAKTLQEWSKCVDRERDAGGDFTEECREAVSGECPRKLTQVIAIALPMRHPASVVQTLALRQCMLSNPEYYAPLLEEEDEEARRAAEAAAALEADAGKPADDLEASSHESKAEE
jgi:hypothetical protein